ncbi:hypothetical protein [Siccibacter colletis]|uniref:hypothetical protein n=1 Tax=Siccibacter colletis TaxID=1505757 RepID=UPI003CF71F73
MSGIGVGEYLSAMRHEKEALLPRFEDFWDEIFVKARDARNYQGHIILSDRPDYFINLDGTGLSILVRKRVVFFKKRILLEMDFYRERKDEEDSILKIYLDNQGNLYLGHPDEVQPLEFFYEDTASPFFDALIKSASSGGFISIDRSAQA